jgi:hypothetical protein
MPPWCLLPVAVGLLTALLTEAANTLYLQGFPIGAEGRRTVVIFFVSSA